MLQSSHKLSPCTIINPVLLIHKLNFPTILSMKEMHSILIYTPDYIMAGHAFVFPRKHTIIAAMWEYSNTICLLSVILYWPIFIPQEQFQLLKIVIYWTVQFSYQTCIGKTTKHACGWLRLLTFCIIWIYQFIVHPSIHPTDCSSVWPQNSLKTHIRQKSSVLLWLSIITWLQAKLHFCNFLLDFEFCAIFWL